MSLPVIGGVIGLAVLDVDRRGEGPAVKSNEEGPGLHRQPGLRLLLTLGMRPETLQINLDLIVPT